MVIISYYFVRVKLIEKDVIVMKVDAEVIEL